MLEIRDLHVSVEGKKILKGVHLNLPDGEIHAMMGPNGSGKSTLSYALMGHPRYLIESGDILFRGESILDWPTEKRAQRGMFLSFQYPPSLPGVTLSHFLRNSLKYLHAKREDDTTDSSSRKDTAPKEIPIKEFRKNLKETMKSLQIKAEFTGRYVNEGFSGGEKKRNELLQMNLMKPRLAIFDEIDSGLDIDALRIVAENIESHRSPSMSMLLITHYQRLLENITVDKVHVFSDGCIVKSGSKDLAEQLEKDGYDWIERESVDVVK